jgi:ribosome-associated protein
MVQSAVLRTQPVNHSTSDGNTFMSIIFPVRGEHIQLDQLLKATGLCASGGWAHAEIDAGKVRVDDLVETRKRAKLRPGQRVSYAGETVQLLAEPSGGGEPEPRDAGAV